ncbi:hypothetical protein [Stieleria mannarensis]|uniref:hypothetical protein n=1 Tax=Stieleria mannarensis TaxID=2755585 RepID=UPI001C7272AC|nr:hypothetical protein [Rhodopirellula sp. JC639]
MAMLLAMASQASGDESRDVVMKALSQYARDHMHDWLPAAFWQRCKATHLEYFSAVSQWRFVFWHTPSDLHQWPSDRLPENHLTPITDPGDPYQCGAPGLHQIRVNGSVEDATGAQQDVLSNVAASSCLPDTRASVTCVRRVYYRGTVSAMMSRW